MDRPCLLEHMQRGRSLPWGGQRSGPTLSSPGESRPRARLSPHSCASRRHPWGCVSLPLSPSLSLALPPSLSLKLEKEFLSLFLNHRSNKLLSLHMTGTFLPCSWFPRGFTGAFALRKEGHGRYSLSGVQIAKQRSRSQSLE